TQISHFGRMTFRNTACAFSTVNVCHVGRNVYAARPERYHTPTTADSSLASNGRTSLARSLISVRLTSCRQAATDRPTRRRGEAAVSFNSLVRRRTHSAITIRLP